MKKSRDKRRFRAENDLERSLARSADVLVDVIRDVELCRSDDDFMMLELGRMIQDREPSLEDRDFRYLIEQGIRLTLSPDMEVRARLLRRLRRAYPQLSTSAKSSARHVIGAIEDRNFPLERIGAVVRSYTQQLFQALENAPDATRAHAAADAWIQKWRSGTIARSQLDAELGALGPNSVPAVADTLFESLHDPPTVDAMLEVLARLEFPVAARVLAFVIAEPVLEEHHEEKARSILKKFWPLPRAYIYYKLRQHLHEDIPYRWLELLIDVDDTRAVDRILEELVAHGRAESYRQDLLSIMGLLERSRDPGVVGKLLRLLTEESLPRAVVELIEEWVESSPLGPSIDAAFENWKDGKVALVSRTEDFNAFASTRAGKSFEVVRAEWNAAYHESLGWQQPSQMPHGPIESEFDRRLEEAMLERLSLNPRLEESALREQVESFGEDWLVTPQDKVVPLVAICLERHRNTPWLDEIHWNDINDWYVRAASHFDSGNHTKAQKYLELILTVEPDYPLARVLKEIAEG